MSNGTVHTPLCFVRCEHSPWVILPVRFSSRDVNEALRPTAAEGQLISCSVWQTRSLGAYESDAETRLSSYRLPRHSSTARLLAEHLGPKWFAAAPATFCRDAPSNRSTGKSIESNRMDRNSLPLAYLTDQRRPLFDWNRLYNSGNSLLNSLSSVCYGNMTSLAAKYDIYSPPPSTRDFEIKLHSWKSSEKTVVNWCMCHLLYDLFYTL